MPTDALALALAAAVLHAAWNALAKRARDPLVFLWWAVALGTLALAPFAVPRLVREGLGLAALPFLLATVVLHVAYFYALGRAYRAGQYSRVYPVARGLGVALVPVLAAALLGTRPSLLGGAGIALVVCGIACVHRAASPPAPVQAREVAEPTAREASELTAREAAELTVGSATGWAALTGVTIAAYTLVDQAGVARLDPLPYVTLMGAGIAVGLFPAAARAPGGLGGPWREAPGRLAAASLMDLTAYLLVLHALARAPAAYVVAAREISIVLSAVVGSRWLGEGPLGPRLRGALVVLAGVCCVALAR